ncbi:MAG TPA: polysaccharide deacetylase family protein [Gemmatimonadaceae bacterium]|nr:polysaccharide deacetylase family protein [Gemmatimonadaceae bacterium]
MYDTRAEIACLMYHEVTDHPSDTGFQRPAARQYAHSRSAFRDHLERIAARSLTPRLVYELDFDRLGRHLLLTFDDGGKSALDVAEELSRRGWLAHFFVVTSRIGERTFLDAYEIRWLRSCGHVIGSHSHTHPDIFRDQPRGRMLAEWRDSSAILEDILGEPCLAASVPGGDLSGYVLDTASEAGFRFLFTSEPWFTPQRLGDCWIIGRVCLKAGMAPQAIEQLAQFRGWRRAQLLRGLKAVVRRGLGPLYRMYVAHITSPAGAPGIAGAAGVPDAAGSGSPAASASGASAAPRRTPVSAAGPNAAGRESTWKR